MIGYIRRGFASLVLIVLVLVIIVVITSVAVFIFKTPPSKIDLKTKSKQGMEQILNNTELNFKMVLPTEIYQHLGEIGNYDLNNIQSVPANYFKCDFAIWTESQGLQPTTLVSSRLIKKDSSTAPTVYQKIFEYPTSPDTKAQYTLYVFQQTDFTPVSMNCTEGAKYWPEQIDKLINNFQFTVNKKGQEKCTAPELGLEFNVPPGVNCQILNPQTITFETKSFTGVVTTLGTDSPGGNLCSPENYDEKQCDGDFNLNLSGPSFTMFEKFESGFYVHKNLGDTIFGSTSLSTTHPWYRIKYKFGRISNTEIIKYLINEKLKEFFNSAISVK